MYWPDMPAQEISGSLLLLALHRAFGLHHHRNRILLAVQRPFRTAKRLCNVASIQPFDLLGVSASYWSPKGVRVDCLVLDLPGCGFDDGPAAIGRDAAGVAGGMAGQAGKQGGALSANVAYAGRLP